MSRALFFSCWLCLSCGSPTAPASTHATRPPAATAPAAPAALSTVHVVPSVSAGAAVPTGSAAVPAAAAPKTPDDDGEATLPPVVCPQRTRREAIGFVQRHHERMLGKATLVHESPRFVTRDKTFAPGLQVAQKAVDDFLSSLVGPPCKKDCGGSHVACRVTRSDDTFLSVLCDVSYWYPQARSGFYRRHLMFRRVGDALQPLDLQSLARDQNGSLFMRVILHPHKTQTWEGDEPLTQGVPESFYVTMRAKGFEWGTALPHDPLAPGFRGYDTLAPHLQCGTLLDFPPPGATPASAPDTPLATATRVTSTNSAGEPGPWGHAATDIRTVALAAMRPSEAPVATLIHSSIEAYIAPLRKASKDNENMGEVTVSCHMMASTSDLVSVLCSHESFDGKHHAGGRGFNVIVGQPPKPITSKHLLGAASNAPAAISRRCFSKYVRKSEGSFDHVLKAVPKLAPADLTHFGLATTGAVFLIPFSLGGSTRIERCFVPYSLLKTSLPSLRALASR